MSARHAAVAFLAAAIAVIAAACGTVGRTTEGNTGLGKTLFEQKCAGCHTLADAGSQSNVGPNLDEAFDDVRKDRNEESGFEESTIRDVVRGQISYPIEDPVTDAAGMPGIDQTLPRCDGRGRPQGCVDDQDAAADAIAAYVASVAGAKDAGGPGPVGDDPKSIFAARCSSCHTFAAAGALGTIGPNLDTTEFTQDEAATQIANGGGGMPAFKGQLTDKQIRELAKYLVDNR